MFFSVLLIFLRQRLSLTWLGLARLSLHSFNFIHIIRFTLILLFLVHFPNESKCIITIIVNWNENWTRFIYDNFMLMIIIKIIWYLKYKFFIHFLPLLSDVILSTWCRSHYYGNLFRWRHGVLRTIILSHLCFTFFEISFNILYKITKAKRNKHR